jgi:hypothetical protein
MGVTAQNGSEVGNLLVVIRSAPEGAHIAADFRNSPGAIIEIPQLIDPVSCVF